MCQKQVARFDISTLPLKCCGEGQHPPSLLNGPYSFLVFSATRLRCFEYFPCIVDSHCVCDVVMTATVFKLDQIISLLFSPPAQPRNTSIHFANDLCKSRSKTGQTVAKLCEHELQHAGGDRVAAMILALSGETENRQGKRIRSPEEQRTHTWPTSESTQKGVSALEMKRHTPHATNNPTQHTDGRISGFRGVAVVFIVCEVAPLAEDGLADPDVGGAVLHLRTDTTEHTNARTHK